MIDDEGNLMDGYARINVAEGFVTDYSGNKLATDAGLTTFILDNKVIDQGRLEISTQKQVNNNWYDFIDLAGDSIVMPIDINRDSFVKKK